MVTNELTYQRYQAQYETKGATGDAKVWAAYHPYRTDLKKAQNDLRLVKNRDRWDTKHRGSGRFRIVREDFYRTVIHISDENL